MITGQHTALNFSCSETSHLMPTCISNATLSGFSQTFAIMLAGSIVIASIISISNIWHWEFIIYLITNWDTFLCLVPHSDRIKQKLGVSTTPQHLPMPFYAFIRVSRYHSESDCRLVFFLQYFSTFSCVSPILVIPYRQIQKHFSILSLHIFLLLYIHVKYDNGQYQGM